MTRTKLIGANLITTRGLSSVIWTDATCPNGAQGPCGAFATVPFGPEYRDGQGGKMWYEYRTTASPAMPPTPLLGTAGTPIFGGVFTSNWKRADTGTKGIKGIQGTITNASGERLLVRTKWSEFSEFYKPLGVSEVILDPGAEIPYRMYTARWEDRGYNPRDTVDKWLTLLQFFRAPVGQPIGLPVSLGLSNSQGNSHTLFYPPGWQEPNGTRVAWDEQEAHEEIWGSTRLWVKREVDGWQLPSSEAYRSRYKDPNADGLGSPYRIFTIRVESL
jgi:hypothetical protein